MKRLSLSIGLLIAICSMILPAHAQSDATAASPESFQIRNKKFGDLLRPENASGAEGARIVLYSPEPWKCMTWKLHPVSESVFQLQNHFTSKTIVTKADGNQTNVVQTAFAHDSKERPQWKFTKLSDGLYQITDVKTRQALTAVGATFGSTRIVVAPWQNKDEQKWELIKTDPSKLTM